LYHISYQQSHRHDDIVDLFMRALRQAFLSPKKEQPTTIANRRYDLVFTNPDFIKMLHKLIFGDVTVVLPIQEQYFNDTYLKDVNIPMSDAYKRKVARRHHRDRALPSLHLSLTPSANFTQDSSTYSTTQAPTPWINHPPAPTCTHIQLAHIWIIPTTHS
jgi:hypothetical protein